jgi:tetratricopeptide (TPR) repeat protein
MTTTRFGSQGITGLILALGFLLPSASADDGRSIYKKTIHGTVLVKVRFSDMRTSQGTGWVVDKARKLLVTNHHVVQNAELVNVVFPAYADDKAFRNGRPLSSREDYQNKLGLAGRVLDTDADRDLAVIQLEVLPEGTEELKLAAESAGPGERIHSIGNPGASEGMWIHAEGGVRQVYRKHWAEMVGKQAVPCQAWVLETQAPLNHGDSGGPMVNEQGEVVAVVCGGQVMFKGQPVQAINWGIDVREVRAFVDQTTRLLTPKTAADYVLRGERALKRQLFTQAGEDFNAALRLDSNSARAYRNRGLLLRLKGDLQTALADLDRALELDSNDAEAYFQRGLVLWQRGKDSWDKALADYTKAIQRNPAHALAYNNRGFIHESRGDLQPAFADYSQAIAADPNLAAAYTNRGDIYRKRGDYKQAYADYDRAFGIAPSAYCLQQAALTCLDLNEPRQAVNISVLLIKQYHADNAVVFRIQGLGYQRLGNSAAAIESYSEALKRDASHAWTYFQRGQLFEGLGDYRALADYEKAVQLDATWAAKLKTQNRRYLKVVNNYAEPIQVHLYYETLAEQGDWYWYPEAPPEGKDLTFTVEPGKFVFVQNGDLKVQGRRMRIWAEVPQSGKQITTHKDKDVWLCAKEYRSLNRMTFTYTFGQTVKR